MSDEWKDTRVRLSRRRFLHATAGVAAAGVLSEVAAACGSTSSSSQSGSSSAPAGAPKRGGVLSVAAGDAATSENLDPQRVWNQNHDFFYTPAVWETLVLATADWNLVPVLATSWTPNSDATVWTFKMRPGVTWHDGKPLTAQDAAWSIKRILDPGLANPVLGVLSPVLDISGIRAVDSQTLQLHLNYPHDLLPIVFAQSGAEIVQAGSNPTHYTAATAVGTGPFVMKSFAAGQSWEVVRNPTYWQKGLPYLDGMSGVSIPDPTGMVQAVASGASHVASSMNYSQLATLSGSDASTYKVPASHDVYIIMDTRSKPFDDNRVRMALKLAMDRQTIINTAYAGDATGTSDTPTPSSDPLYPRALGVRPQNIAAAKSLLSDAGYSSGLRLQLYTGDLVGGMVDMATVFAQTVAPAGIQVSITEHPAATYFEQIWLQRPFYVSWIAARHPVVRVPMTLTTNAAWQETHLLHTPVDSLLKQAVNAHGQQQDALIGQMLTWIADNQGYICPAFPNWDFPAKKQVQGLQWENQRGLSWSRVWLE
jgi:peptide/nickel transport system substrate-binding protein